MWPLLLARRVTAFGAHRRAFRSSRDRRRPAESPAARSDRRPLPRTRHRRHSRATVLPQVSFLLGICARAPVAGGIAVLAPLPVALLLGRQFCPTPPPRASSVAASIGGWAYPAFKKLVPDGDLVARRRTSPRCRPRREVFLSPQVHECHSSGAAAAERAHVASLAAALPPIALAMWFQPPPPTSRCARRREPHLSRLSDHAPT